MNKTLLVLGIVLVLALGGFFLYKNQFKADSSTLGNYGLGSNTPKTSLNTKVEQDSNQAVIEITKSGFEPETINIKAGAMVIWRNNSGRETSINSANHPTHLVYPPLNLGVIENGKSASLVFDTVGTFKYHDHLRPDWVGTVVVE